MQTCIHVAECFIVQMLSQIGICYVARICSVFVSLSV